MTFTRRRFLQTLVVSAGALSVSSLLTGCALDDDDSTKPVVKYFPQSVMSGDPTPNSVILWTRVVDGSSDLKVILQVSEIENDFTQNVLEKEFDVSSDTGNCLKVRVTDLKEKTHYYYRFVYKKDNVAYSSKVGRTKTAPAAADDAEVKFAFVSCQDYLGRYYNTYLSILEQDDLDFVLHLGDYIYETDGDSKFQDTSGERQLSFRDSDGALQIGTGDSAYKAAQSVDNYRQLYETYRSDPVLQEVHERFPLISIWDDHEFSDDSWQTNATYNDEAAVEEQLQRKQNAEQVYFEFMPIDHAVLHPNTDTAGTGALAVDKIAHLYPNTKIFRDFQFGQNLQLFLTDYRTNRPDHLIKEDAFPAKVEMDTTVITDFLSSAIGGSKPQAYIDAVLAKMHPVINIDLPIYSAQKLLLQNALMQEYVRELNSRLVIGETAANVEAAKRVSDVLTGKLTSSYLNIVLTKAKATLADDHFLKDTPLLPVTAQEATDNFSDATFEKGLAYFTMGKTTLFSDLGARYLVVKSSFDLYAGYRASKDASAQAAYSNAQAVWLAGGLAAAKANNVKNRVVASSVSTAPLLADLSGAALDWTGTAQGAEQTLAAILSNLPASSKALLGQQFYLNVDHWDGFPQGKEQVVRTILENNGVITLSGDIHSSFVTEHNLSDGATQAVDFTTSSVSSGTFGSFLGDGLDTLLSQLGPKPDGIDIIKTIFDDIALASSTRDNVNSKLSFAKMGEHGVSIATANSNGFNVVYHNVEAELNTTNKSYYNDRNAYLDQVNKHEFNWTGAGSDVTKLS